jgi:hypothetical protein
MPVMPRISKKATKIAYSILGVPQNMKYKPTKAEKALNARLIFLETTRIK